MWRRRVATVLRPALGLCSNSQKKTLEIVTNSSKIVQLQGQRRQLASSARRFAEGLVGENGQAGSMASLSSRFANQLNQRQGMVEGTHSFCRPFASSATSEPPGQKQSQGKKEISTVEDPFDSPTYHIPEKPVTFTEGASYSIVILAGLGIAGAAAYAVFKELIFEPKEYKVFSKALERIQNDSEVRVRIGSPIKGYGQESRNRAARQRIPHRVWTDEDGVEHIEVNFYIRGPHGGGKVYCEMFKDKAENQWKYMYLIVDILQPAPKQLILESFLPA
ncbi:hypothetical protein Cgig2_021978 [Carnegiea gigantea]|uniref:Mitochondrial import inner membrane translocase subunit Tim21 n=1 Tax=Carnegiea gigantea TaxID=171969 RepID=A0A9Q1QQ83_9CARY|nr:hypothetical protein Cgig2_021978 [Carnegiea gigantea]